MHLKAWLKTLREHEQVEWDALLESGLTQPMARSSLTRKRMLAASSFESLDERMAATSILRAARSSQLHPERILHHPYGRPTTPQALLVRAEQAITEFPSWHEGHTLKATILHGLLGETSQALDTLELATTQIAHPEIACIQARILADSGQHSIAATLLDNAVPQFSTHRRCIDLLVTRHRIAMIVGDTDDVVNCDVLTPTLDHHLTSRDELAWAEVFIQEIRRERYREGRHEKQPIYRLLSFSTKLLMRALDLRGGSMSLALVHEALALNPYSPQVLYAAALCYVLEGAKGVALEMLETCIKDGDRSMATVFLADPAFLGLREDLEKIVQGYPTNSHATSVEAIVPTSDSLIQLVPTSGCEAEALDVYYNLRGDPSAILELDITAMASGDGVCFWLGMYGDRLYFCYFQMQSGHLCLLAHCVPLVCRPQPRTHHETIKMAAVYASRFGSSSHVTAL